MIEWGTHCINFIWRVQTPRNIPYYLELGCLYNRWWKICVKTGYHYLKLPSLFAAWPFWTFHTKSHNIKALVTLSNSWSAFLPLVHMEKMNFCGSLCSLLEYFLEKKTPLRLPTQITWPWPPVGSFSHGLITVRQRKMWTYHC